MPTFQHALGDLGDCIMMASGFWCGGATIRQKLGTHADMASIPWHCQASEQDE